MIGVCFPAAWIDLMEKKIPNPIVIITFLGLAGEDFKKYQMPAFYFGCILVVVVAVARILAAAHFLSDVSWGAAITLALVIIANEVVMRVKALQLKKE